MPLTPEQKKYVNLFGANLTFEELAKRLNCNYDIVRHYCKRHSINTKSARLVSTITKEDISIIVQNLGKKRKKDIVAMCKANANVISKWAKKHNIDWKNRLGTLTDAEKEIVTNHLHLKPGEVVKMLRVNNPTLKYDVVYNYHQKQKELNCVTKQKTIEHSKFDLKFLDSPDKFLVGPYYPYPSNIQFLQP